MAIVVIGIYLGFKREFYKLIGFLVVALIAVGLVFNAGGVKDVLLELFNKRIKLKSFEIASIKPAYPIPSTDPYKTIMTLKNLRRITLNQSVSHCILACNTNRLCFDKTPMKK